MILVVVVFAPVRKNFFSLFRVFFRGGKKKEKEKSSRPADKPLKKKKKKKKWKTKHVHPVKKRKKNISNNEGEKYRIIKLFKIIGRLRR